VEGEVSVVHVSLAQVLVALHERVKAEGTRGVLRGVDPPKDIRKPSVMWLMYGTPERFALLPL
jgi:hypothetical protein